MFSVSLVQLGAVVVVFGMVRCVKWLSRPIYHRHQTINDVPRHLRSLLEAGGHGGVLHLDHDGSQKFLQFVKRGTSERSRYIHFGFPDTDWARPFYEELAQRLTSSGVQSAQRITDDRAVPRILVVDMLNVEDAARVARAAAEVMGIADDTFTIHYEGPGPSGVELRERWQDVKRVTRTRTTKKGENREVECHNLVV